MKSQCRTSIPANNWHENTWAGPAVALLALLVSTSAFGQTETKLTAADAAAGDQFGVSVAVDGDTVIVGAFGDDDAGNSSGAAYVFQRNQGGADSWGQVTKITADDAAADDVFGVSVAVDGDTAIVGAYFDDDAGNRSGAAYLFGRNQGGADSWGQIAKLTASDAAADDLFGIAVAVNGDTAIVGAYLDDDGGIDSGSAYVFRRNQGGADSWGQVAKITADDAAADDQFGIAVAVNGDTAIVGACLDDDAGDRSGSAYIFQRNQGGADSWGQVTKIIADDASADELFGRSVAVNGDTALVGASGASGGAAYIFRRSEGGADSWGQVTKITASDAAAGDGFGTSAAVSGDTAIVGALFNDDVGLDSGAAYVFGLPPSPGPTLEIPDRIVGVAVESVEVPVVLGTAGSALAATAFSVDYDEICLDFDPIDVNADGIPDAMTFDVAADFTPTVFVDLGDTDGEIDISVADASPPFTSLADGTLVTLTFTARCTPIAPATILAPVRFSTDPAASFHDTMAQSVPGTTEDGSVQIFAGLPGDCSADGQVDALDLIACIAEIFDGDGSDWLAVPGGTFPGDPIGCDANADTTVDAGDLTCTNRRIVGLACGAGTRAIRGQPPMLRPWLGLPDAVTVNNDTITVDVRLTPRNHALSTTTFALDYDETRLAFDPTDGDGDGLPDAVQFLGASVSNQSVIFDAARVDGELSVLVADLVQNPQLLVKGPLIRIAFEVLDATAPLATALRFSPSLPPSFGDISGRSVRGGFGYGEGPFFEDGFESGTLDAWMP